MREREGERERERERGGGERKGEGERLVEKGKFGIEQYERDGGREGKGRIKRRRDGMADVEIEI